MPVPNRRLGLEKTQTGAVHPMEPMASWAEARAAKINAATESIYVPYRILIIRNQFHQTMNI